MTAFTDTRYISDLEDENRSLRQGNEVLRERLAEERGKVRELSGRVLGQGIRLMMLQEYIVRLTGKKSGTRHDRKYEKN